METTTLYLIVTLALNILTYGVKAHRVRRLIGGNDSIEFEFPYQASLRYYGVHICSGALISDRHILSAAHCICGMIDDPSEELSVGIGSINFKDCKIHAVKNFECYPGYVFGPKKSWVGDLAIVTLVDQIRTSPSQSPIALAISDIPVGEHVVISGWGRVHQNSFHSQTLQKLSVPIIDNEVCQGYYKNTTILNSQLCTFEKKGVGACKGDSGSPLVYNNTLIAIFSWTEPCAIGFPDVFTRVGYYIDFIEEAMQNK